jgi:integrase
VDWDEIDVANKVWRVPAGKYKSENNWAIPLCKEAIKILKAQPSARHKEGRVFSRLDGGPLYSAALSEMPKALGFKADDGRYAVANGFRRTFRTWGQAMEFNNEAAELQMKHLNTNALKQVYIDDPEGWALFDRRKQIIDAYEKWAMKGDIGSDNVVDLQRGRKAS